MVLPDTVFSSAMGDETPRRFKLTYEFKRGLRQQWLVRNPILRAGEPGVELDTGYFKLGDGVTQWIDLPYYFTEDAIMDEVRALIADIPGGGGGGVSGVSDVEFEAHIESEDPHPNYDDGTSFLLRYQNAKV